MRLRRVYDPPWTAIDDMTFYERAVLRDIAEGKSYEQIAREQGVTRGTVNSRVSQMFDYLDVRTGARGAYLYAQWEYERSRETTMKSIRTASSSPADITFLMSTDGALSIGIERDDHSREIFHLTEEATSRLADFFDGD